MKQSTSKQKELFYYGIWRIFCYKDMTKRQLSLVIEIEDLLGDESEWDDFLWEINT
jgi:hypothetical protein